VTPWERLRLRPETALRLPALSVLMTSAFCAPRERRLERGRVVEVTEPDLGTALGEVRDLGGTG